MEDYIVRRVAPLRGVLGLDQASLVPVHRPEVWQIDG
jgi:hypothetical protein